MTGPAIVGSVATRSGPPAAVIFDVDGTLVDSERDGHRVAFNRAFEELGLPDRWDVDHYGELLHITGGTRRLDAHLASRGMPAAEREPLAARLHRRKTEIFREMVADGMVAPRPGIGRLLVELEDAGIRMAIATTGTRAWVAPLLEKCFGRDRFEVVVTGDEAPVRKPDPSAYVLTLRRLGIAPDQAVSVEDSRNGLEAALAADLACVVVVNRYTRDQDFGGAALVMDGFGDAEHAATVLHDPHSTRPDGVLRAETLELVAIATAPR